MRTAVAPGETLECAPDSLVGVHPLSNSESGITALLAKAMTAIRQFCTAVPARFEVVNLRTGEVAGGEWFPDGTLADRFARELGSDWRVIRSTADAAGPLPVARASRPERGCDA